MFIVVAYDVNTETPAGEKRLRWIAKKCMKYGQRVQNSVFECMINPSDYLVLKHELSEIMDKDADSLRIYRLGSKIDGKVEQLGRQKHLPINGVMLI
ncbi:CRISPR-associated endonuclease Cas2 [uncultured Scardovia sp.]|uniref:CRISPR-associated endonuclease Cas2 n=1 Tax=Scardovia wiggsiae TaxID=230143 RepID=UPI00360951FA